MELRALAEVNAEEARRAQTIAEEQRAIAEEIAVEAERQRVLAEELSANCK